MNIHGYSLNKLLEDHLLKVPSFDCQETPLCAYVHRRTLLKVWVFLSLGKILELTHLNFNL